MIHEISIDIRHYRYFIAVAKHLHFRKAAEEMYVTQPNLSRHILQLETYLGLTLLLRSNRSVALTASGEHLYTYIVHWLNQHDEILESTRAISQGVGGTIRLAYVGSAMHGMLPSILTKFSRKYNNIIFNLTEMNNNQQLKQVFDRQIDIGFVRLNEAPKEINIKPIKKETFSLVLPSAHKMTQGKFKSLEQLKEEEFIFFEKEYSPMYYERILSIFEDCGISPHIKHKSVHATTIFRLVENGFGISIVPTSLKAGYDMNIKFIELKNIPQRAVLSMIWRKDQEKNSVKFFMDMVVDDMK